jgi:hypothetical protein
MEPGISAFRALLLLKDLSRIRVNLLVLDIVRIPPAA